MQISSDLEVSIELPFQVYPLYFERMMQFSFYGQVWGRIYLNRGFGLSLCSCSTLRKLEKQNELQKRMFKTDLILSFRAMLQGNLTCCSGRQSATVLISLRALFHGVSAAEMSLSGYCHDAEVPDEPSFLRLQAGGAVSLVGRIIVQTSQRRGSRDHAERFSSFVCSFVTDLTPENIQLSHKHMSLVPRGTGWETVAGPVQIHHPWWETTETTWLGGREPPHSPMWIEAASELPTKYGLCPNRTVTRLQVWADMFNSSIALALFLSHFKHR